MGKKLFVGSLDFSTTDAELNDLFSQHGTVVSAKVISDRDTGRSRGFGFVEYATEEEAQKAIEALDGTALQGRNINVSEARERAPRGGGSRDDRRGGGRSNRW